MAELISNEIFLCDEPVAFGFYPDGQPVVDWSQSGYKPSKLTLRSTSVDTLMTALWLADGFAERGWQIPTLLIPCLPGARQDRLSLVGDFLFGAKSVAAEINMRGFDQVLCFDAHSDVMPSLIDRCVNIQADEAFKAELFKVDGIDCVVAPDAGAVKRAAKVAAYFGVPVIQAWKTRDPESNKLSGFGFDHDAVRRLAGDVDSVQDIHLKGLVVDDICDGGGTFVGLGEKIRQYFPNLWLNLYVSHGYFAKGVDDIAAVYSGIYTTNSTVNAENLGDKVTVADIIPLLSMKAS